MSVTREYMLCSCGSPLYENGMGEKFCNNMGCDDNKLGSKPLPPEMLPPPVESEDSRVMRRTFKGIR